MTKETLFILNPQGGLARWDISKTELNLTEAITHNFCSNVVRQLMCAFPMAMIDADKEATGVAALTVLGNGDCVVSMPLPGIPLAAPFAVEGNQMFPHFDGAHPVVKLTWKTPRSMRLVLAVSIDQSLKAYDQHLVAFDSINRGWRLPISNLYEDCRLCTGTFEAHGTSVIDICQKAWNQFQLSQWNSHLYNDSNAERRSKTRKLFTYTVSNEKITQQPFDGDWTLLCEKVATDHITRHIIP